MSKCYDPNYYMYGGTYIEPPFGGAATTPYGPNSPACHMHHNHCNGDCDYNRPMYNPAYPPENDYSYYLHPPMIPSSGCHCDGNIETFPAGLVNIKTRLLLSLELTLCGRTEEDNVTIILETDKKYKVTHSTENGLVEIVGILKYIDHNIPIDCLMYLNNFNSEIVMTAFLIFDASTECGSNIVRMPIRAIRSIEEIVAEQEPEDPEQPPEDEEP